MPIILRKRSPSDGVMGVSLLELRSLDLYAGLMEENAGRIEKLLEGGELPHVPEGTILEQFAEATAERLVPEMLRRSLVISLHAALEYSVIQANLILDGYESGPGFHGRGFEAAKDHLKAAHAYELLEPITDERPIWILNRLRHALAHALGSRFAVPARRWQTLQDDSRQFGGFALDQNRVVLHADLFSRLHGPVTEVVVGLVETVRNRVDASGSLPGGGGLRRDARMSLDEGGRGGA